MRFYPAAAVIRPRSGADRSSSVPFNRNGILEIKVRLHVAEWNVIYKLAVATSLVAARSSLRNIMESHRIFGHPGEEHCAEQPL